MIQHNIITLEFNSLYQILSEMKDHFVYKLKKHNLSEINNLDLKIISNGQELHLDVHTQIEILIETKFIQ